MINSIANPATTSSTGSTSSSNPSSATAAVDPLASESTFLKLLVSQLKNQDPLNPQDGTQFVAQLATFSGLEQQLQIRQDLDSIKQTLQTPTTTTGSTGTGTTSTTTA